MDRPRFEDHEEHVRVIVESALRAVEPGACVRAALRAHPTRMKRPAVIALGKAAGAMYEGYVAACEKPAHRLMILPEGAPGPAWALRGTHPVPSEASLEASRALETFVTEHRGTCDGFVVLLSGGASALTTAPSPGLGLADLQQVTNELLRAGADIRELNWVRKHLERLKGGRLAALMAPRPVDAYILSDVADNDLSVIGSGPLHPDGSTFGDALRVVRLRGVEASGVVEFLEAGAAGRHPETPKRGDPVFHGVREIIAGDNLVAVKAAGEAAMHLGFRLTKGSALRGEAREMAPRLLDGIVMRRPGCAISGGETTVTVGKAKGMGGRNQELALASAILLAGKDRVALAVVASDGIDGPTDAAGAVVTGGTCAEAERLGINPAACLAEHDSYAFFATVGKHLKLGPTGTNVNDLAVILMY